MSSKAKIKAEEILTEIQQATIERQAKEDAKKLAHETKPHKSTEHVGGYDAQMLLSGVAGYALQAVALQAVNYSLSISLANHPTLKMPVEKPETPDELRDLMETNPEFEPEKNVRLDQLVNAIVATCALIKDLGEVRDVNQAGETITPYAWIAERARTPQSSIVSQFEWRAEQNAKLAAEQARLIGIADTAGVEAKTKERTNGQNKERLAYAIAEIKSVINTGLLKESTDQLVNILTDLDGYAFDVVALTKSAAQRDMDRAKQRLQAGLFARVDEEVMLFANK